MPTFKFEAVDNNGLLVKNRIEAASTEADNDDDVGEISFFAIGFI